VVFNQDSKFIIEPITDFLKNQDFDAILFGTNRIGVCGLKVMSNLGIKVPDDTAVISFDDYDVFELYSPSITAIAQPIEEIADNVITILLHKLNTPASNRNVEKITLHTELKLRGSSSVQNPPLSLVAES
jgi:LacI family transcriptional regulator